MTLFLPPVNAISARSRGIRVQVLVPPPFFGMGSSGAGGFPPSHAGWALLPAWLFSCSFPPLPASANICNVVLMRHTELEEGIDVLDEEGNVVGSSRIAARHVGAFRLGEGVEGPTRVRHRVGFLGLSLLLRE